MNCHLLQLAGGEVALISPSDYLKVRDHYWRATYVDGRPYVYGYLRGVKPRKWVMLHRLIVPTPLYVDHINGNGFDNRRENLREATNQQNQGNRRRRPRGTSKHRGVCWVPSREKWKAGICVNHRNKHLGYFTSEEDAARAYNRAAASIFGEFFVPNEVSDV